MALSWEDRLKLWFMPGGLYYRRKLESESRKGEPEVAVLPDLLRGRGGTAVDVGCNRGIFSFLLSGLFDRVVAFEPNPDLAEFARRKLPGSVEVMQFALGAAQAEGRLQIPAGRSGGEDHLMATLTKTGSAPTARTIGVEVRPLDSLELGRVGFIKIDVEGTELAVIEGGRRTIARDRPPLMVELLAGTYDDPAAVAMRICKQYDYRCEILTENGFVEAIAHLRAGLPTASRNVLFWPSD